MRKKQRYAWVKSAPLPAKLSEAEKLSIKEEVQTFIENSPRLSKAINRFDVKAGRICFYHRVEQFGWDDPGMPVFLCRSSTGNIVNLNMPGLPYILINIPLTGNNIMTNG